jgi:hypothetical protein
MENQKQWSEMTWQEKREERFKRWLSPINTKFNSPEAERLYKERVMRFIKAFKLEEPDRVPVMLPTGNFPAYYSGVSYNTIINDYDVLKKAWIKFMDDFGDMDYFRGATLAIPAKVYNALNLKSSVWPGHGLPLDATMMQYVEGEYMKADEYDRWMNDPSDFNMRVLLPRTTGIFEAFTKLPPLRSAAGMSLVGAMGNPEIRKAFQIMGEASEDLKKFNIVNSEISDISVARGYATFRTGGPMVQAPFDYFADHLRGTRGISMDMNRQPQKLHEAMERYLQINLATIKNFPMTNCPVVMMPLHKGDDTFMSDKQFETFYWPYYRRVLMAMIEEGLMPMPFAEGKFTKRLHAINDTPKSGVAWYFDQTDMALAKKVIGDRCCIIGNVPTSVVITSPKAHVKEYCRKLIEDCGQGGGYILTGGASIDRGNIENLHAMMEAAYEYGVYKH